MNTVKIEVIFKYPSQEFTIVGLVDTKEFEECKKYGCGYVEGSDVMTDAEGFDVIEILEGREEFNAHCLISNGSVGTASWKLIEDNQLK